MSLQTLIVSFENTRKCFIYPLGSFILCIGGAVTALLSGTFPTLETTDLLQDRKAAGRSLVDITKAAAAVAALRDNTVGAGGLLDLCEGDLQTGQRVFSVYVLFSVVPVLVV